MAKMLLVESGLKKFATKGILIGMLLAPWFGKSQNPTDNPKTANALEFLNGDVLKGTFLAYDPQLGIRWENNILKQVLTVKPEGISRIRLKRTDLQQTNRPNCQAKLANGDEFSGNFVDFDGEKLALDTWYGGRLQISRTALKSLNLFLNKSPIVYEGPSGTDGWTVKANGNVISSGFGGQIIINGGVVIQNGQIFTSTSSLKPGGGWQYKEDGFYGIGNGSIGRDVKLPPTSNIEFDLTYRGYPQFAVYFYSDFLEGFSGNAYVLQFSYRNAFLRRQGAQAGGHNFGSVELPSLAQKGKTRVSIRTQREQKTIALLLDDMLIKEWNDTSELAGNGTGIMFLMQGQNPIKVSNLLVSEWDGTVENAGQTNQVTLKEDVIRLANRDKVSGTLKTLKNGKLTMQTQFATLDIPLERITQVHFNPETMTKIIADSDSRLFLAEHGRISLQLEKYDTSQVVGLSAAMGKIKLAPNAFDSIQFNPTKPRKDTDALDTMGFGNQLFEIPEE